VAADLLRDDAMLGQLLRSQSALGRPAAALSWLLWAELLGRYLGKGAAQLWLEKSELPAELDGALERRVFERIAQQ
jgi:hypothetical protein